MSEGVGNGMAATTDTKRSVTTWKHGARFEHRAGSVTYYSDANLKQDPDYALAGPTPMEMLLGSLAGCTGVDLVDILEKMRVSVRALRIDVAADRADGYPRVYERIHLDYHLETEPVDERRVLRALRLSTDKYCSVSAMLSGNVPISFALRYDGRRHEGVFHDAGHAT